MKNAIGPFFLVLSSVTSLKRQFKGVHKLIWQLLWNYESIFLGPVRLLKTKNSGKKAKFPLKENLWTFFLVVSNITIVMEQSYMGPEVIWEVLCNYYMTISSGPKKVENQTFQQKASFLATKDFGFIFS